MAGSTPIYGIPYPQASDLVANYPALGEDLAEKVDEKLPRYQSAAPTSPSVGQVWIDSDDNLGRVWTGSVWQLFSGAGNANFTDAATGTYSSGGIDYKYKTYTASGTATFDKAGKVDVLVVAGGGGGSSGGGEGGGSGAGGYALYTGYTVTAATLTITIGAGGSSIAGNTTGALGNSSRFDLLTTVGGGGGQGPETYATTIARGASGGGGKGSSANAGAVSIAAWQGNAGGTGFAGGANSAGGGGGGAAAVGANGASLAGGAGGAGLSNTLTGSTVFYSGGGGGVSGGSNGAGGAGGGGSNSAGAANTGGGGSGNNSGGSGVVIIRVRTN